MTLDSVTRETLAAKLAKACLRDGELTPDSLMAEVEAGTVQEWSEGGTIVLTRLVERPEGKGCRIIMAAGDFDEIWRLHDDCIEPWAREIGQEFMIGDGRLGWRKSAEARGYRYMGYKESRAGFSTIWMLKDLVNERIV